MNRGPLHRGFTLIETVIVVTLAAAVLTVALLYVGTLSKSQQRDQLIEKMAQEIAMIERAMDEHMAGAVLAAVPNRVRTQVTIPQLISANRLPADFANRDGAIGTSPFGQPYRIHVFSITGALAAGENALTWAITEGNGPLASRLARIGIEDTDDGVLGVKQAVAGALAKQHRLISGVIRGGSTTVTGDFNGFTKNIAYLLPAGPTTAQRSWVAVLHGFSDLATGTEITPPTAFSGDCRVIEASRGCVISGQGGTANCTNAAATWTTPQCSTLGAGWVQTDTVTVCPPIGQVSIRSTPVGTLSYATVTDQISLYSPYAGSLPTCVSSCSGAFPCDQFSAAASGLTWRNFNTYQDLRINDTSVATHRCYTDAAYNGAYGSFGLVCGYGRAQVPWANPTVLGSNPRHILCCKPD